MPQRSGDDAARCYSASLFAADGLLALLHFPRAICAPPDRAHAKACALRAAALRMTLTPPRAADATFAMPMMLMPFTPTTRLRLMSAVDSASLRYARAYCASPRLIFAADAPRRAASYAVLCYAKSAVARCDASRARYSPDDIEPTSDDAADAALMRVRGAVMRVICL